jgi:hypothetical protein
MRPLAETRQYLKADENPNEKESVEKAVEAKETYDSLDEEIKAFIDEELYSRRGKYNYRVETEVSQYFEKRQT